MANMENSGNNVKVLNTTDHSHVQQMCPMEMKFKELVAQRAETEPQERMQELENNIRRYNAQARPLGGIGK